MRSTENDPDPFGKGKGNFNWRPRRPQRIGRILGAAVASLAVLVALGSMPSGATSRAVSVGQVPVQSSDVVPKRDRQRRGPRFPTRSRSSRRKAAY